jgi:hypothetical protein
MDGIESVCCGAVTDTREVHTVGVVAARIGLVVGGSVCLVLTPPWALAYQRAYGAGEGETINAWIKQFDWLSWVSGLDAISTYERYGAMFGFALAVVAFCLAVVVRSRKGKGKWERRGWLVTIGGLGVEAVGSMSDEWGLELLGLLLIMIGTPILGWALRREAGVGFIQAIGIALIGPLGVIVGTVVNGHIPGGPATPIIIAAMIIGITGLPDTSRP